MFVTYESELFSTFAIKFVATSIQYKTFCYLFLFLIEPHKYQLWAYIYQARDLLAMDESGMNGESFVIYVIVIHVLKPSNKMPYS